MRRSWLTLGIMLALVAALGLWVWLRPVEKGPSRERVSTTAPDAARELRVEWPGKAAVAMKKEGGTWRIAAPHAGRADSLQVERVLSLLAATSELSLPATDLARFELDLPRARVTVDGRAYAMGGVNPVTGGVYLQRGDSVLLLEPRYAGAIPAQPAAFNDKHVLGAHEAPVAFSFPQFRVAQQDGKWTVTPGAADLSQDEMLRWVEGWRLAAALRAEPFEGRAPARSIAVELRDGRSIAIGIVEFEGEIAFVRDDEHLRYSFFANSARRLLAPPGTPPK